MEGKIPVIDLQEFELQPLKLREASEKWGCFRLVNHGIPTKLMAEMKGVVRDLHDLPVEIKQRNTDVLSGTGYYGPCETNPFYEALGLYNVGSSCALSCFCSQLQVSDQQRETIEMYAQAIHKLAVYIAGKLAKSMGLANYCFDEWRCMLRINRYTYTQTSIGVLGFHTHTDAGFLTILQDDEELRGLEVMEPSGTFVEVDPWPGTLVVNFGDVAVPWSNGRLLNVQHRVRCRDVRLRYSIATSISPPLGQIIEAPKEFVDAGHPRLFRPFTYEEYRKLRFPHKMHGDVLEELRVKKQLS